MSRHLKYLWASLLLLFLPVIALTGQDKTADPSYVQSVRDSVEQYYKKHPWEKPGKDDSKVLTTPIYGVVYSPERELTAMGGFLTMYPSSTQADVPLSQIGAIASVSTNLSFSGTVMGANYAAKGHFFTRYSVKYYRNPWRFWGLGYENGSDDSNRSSFLENRIKARIDLLYRGGNKVLAGIFLGYDYYRAEDFSAPHLVTGLPTSTDYMTAGLRADFDTRDRSMEPQRGVFLQIEPSVNIPTAGSMETFFRVEFTADFYFPLWRGAVMALDFYGDMASQASPWTMWNETGGDTRLRGYYTGRYRDRNFISAQAELRQHIYKGHGLAIWGGAGNIFPSFKEFEIAHTLPTYGIGYRFSIWGITFRVDAAFGKDGQYGIYAGINQAF